MEDYLEMLMRSGQESVHVNDLARSLHVKPSSVSRMAGKLAARGMLTAKRYGSLQLTEKGKRTGALLIRRHDILTEFFTFLNQGSDVLEEVEQIEHYLRPKTVENLAALTERLYLQADDPQSDGTHKAE